MANPNDIQSIIFLYERLYRAKYDDKPILNRYRLNFAFGSVVDDIGVEATKELLEFYFSTLSTDRHDPESFVKNYDRIIRSRIEDEERKHHVDALKEQSRLRAQEWAKHHKTLGNQ